MHRFPALTLALVLRYTSFLKRPLKEFRFFVLSWFLYLLCVADGFFDEVDQLLWNDVMSVEEKDSSIRGTTMAIGMLRFQGLNAFKPGLIRDFFFVPILYLGR